MSQQHPLRSIIDEQISWDSIGKHEKSEYIYELGEATLNRSTGALVLPIKLNFIIPFDDCEKIKGIIINGLNGHVKNVDLEFNYQDVILSKEEVIRLFLPHAASILNGEYYSMTRQIQHDNFIINGNNLTLMVYGKVTADLLNSEVASRYEAMLRDKFNIKYSVSFDVDQRKYDDLYDNFVNSEVKDLMRCLEDQKKALRVQAENKKVAEPKAQSDKPWQAKSGEGGEKQGFRRRQKELPADGDYIMGKRILGEKSVELRDIDPKLGKVIVEGILYKKENKILKTGNYIAKLLITDKKTTVLCSGFVSEDKWNEIDSLLSPGDSIKIQGEVEYNLYESMNSIKFELIEKVKKASSREDLSEIGKRVELHIHSKMSSMDGLNEASEIVKQAALWGHPAVAITDHGVVQAFPDAAKEAGKQADKGRPIKIIYGVEGYVFDDSDCHDAEGNIDYKSKNTNHIIILAKNQEGLKNIYKLVSYSHINYYYKRPRLPWSVIEANREGLIIGSACEAGEVYHALLKIVTYDKRGNKKVKEQATPEEVERIASRYDYLEIQPVINNSFMFDKEYYHNGERITSDDDLRAINIEIADLAKKLGKPIIATTDAHYGDPDDAIYRNILMAGMGYKDAENGQGLYMKTTDEMLKEFSYLGKERAIEAVITNTNLIADMVDEGILPVPKGKFPPRIAGAKETLRTSCMEKAYSMYGNPLPEVIGARLKKELSSIIDNGYAVMYVSAQMLVHKSLADGYLVGSRGSVGSSFAATMAGITEVNPLDPHYVCPECKHIEWGDMNLYDCGIDMPPKNCPECGHEMKRDGFTIPFATFLGFDGDKEPDIDLNFAGEYQPVAHKYVGVIFGEKNVFKAGTVGTVAEKTAFGYVMKFFEERGIPVNKYEAERLAEHCTGVKRTTGQHPGGIVIVPDDHEIYEFCPVQHPANDTETDIVTTHFDYHKIDQNLLKLDILGHDVPQMIRQLQDMTGVDPLNIDLTDRTVLSIFNGIEALNIKDPDYKFVHGTYAIPEFGTPFTRQMLDDIHPQRFADLVRISGFSHGTDVWLNNAQLYIRNGTATMSEVISTRDDIMNYLMLKGIENKMSFKIMEDVRKNRPLKEEQLTVMKEHGVPDWYIDSCIKIQYMFPRAHAVAYVMMSFRMAWFKVYYPPEFYATYFTTKSANFDDVTILKGKEAILEQMELIDAKGNNATAKEKDDYIILEVAYEMYARGFEFLPARLGESRALRFWVKDGKVLLPFVAVNGVGETAAVSLYNEYEKQPFSTIEDAVTRAKLNKTVLQGLKDHGVFEGLQETDQFSMF